MKKTNIATLVAVSLIGTVGSATAADSVTAALEESKASIDARYRIENHDLDGNSKQGTASTVRLRAGVTTGEVAGFSGHVDFEDVRVVGESGLYGGTRPGVLDPEGTELNQGYLQYKAGDATTVKFGRQRVILDNARFVGNVGWRQNEQTYDGLTVANTSVENVTLVYGYVTGVHGITFNDINATAHLLNASIDNLGPGKLTGYGYFIENDVTKAELDTVGVRYAGKADAGDMKVLYTAEFASQSATAGAAKADPTYTLLEGGVKLSNGLVLKLGLETLGSDKATSFSTPLATAHAFNGWADKFAAGAPGDGLQDLYVKAATKVAGVKLVGVFHKFDADQGNNDYGSEIDLLAVKKFNKHYTAGLKLASYAQGDATTAQKDTQKIWLWGQAKF